MDQVLTYQWQRVNSSDLSNAMFDIGTNVWVSTMKEYHNYNSKKSDLADFQFAKNYVNHQGSKLLSGVFVSQSITIQGIKNVLTKQAALILKIPRISLPYLKKPCGGFYSHFLCIFIRLFRSKMTKNPVSRQKNAKIL